MHWQLKLQACNYVAHFSHPNWTKFKVKNDTVMKFLLGDTQCAFDLKLFDWIYTLFLSLPMQPHSLIFFSNWWIPLQACIRAWEVLPHGCFSVLKTNIWKQMYHLPQNILFFIRRVPFSPTAQAWNPNFSWCALCLTPSAGWWASASRFLICSLSAIAPSFPFPRPVPKCRLYLSVPNNLAPQPLLLTFYCLPRWNDRRKPASHSVASS